MRLTPTPFNIRLPRRWGQITQSYIPPSFKRAKPDFILIQNVHCNSSVQHAVSNILGELKANQMLPRRLGVEGAVGAIDVTAMQREPNAKARRKTADYLVSQGEMTGVMHFVISEGTGELYGVENSRLYETSIKMFQNSYGARAALRKDLDNLEVALQLLENDRRVANNASILFQDIQVIRRLVDQQLAPDELRQVLRQAVFAVDHLKHIVSKRMGKNLLVPVSASVDFYALALLRDRAFLDHALELRDMDRQETTVIVAGGFHTAGMTARLKEWGFSYVVITPEVKQHTLFDERLYVERVLGYHHTVEAPEQASRLPSTQALEPRFVSPMARDEVWSLAAQLREELATVQLSIPPITDVFTAMDLPWVGAVNRDELVTTRARLLKP